MNKEREINIPDISDISDWPSCYQMMVNDLTRSIIYAQANYLIALGLFCYTEVLGLHLLQFRARNRNADFAPRTCFNTFAKEYLDYTSLLDKYKDLDDIGIYGVFRNGLCHEYFIKVPRGGQGFVSLYYSDSDLEKIKSQGVDTSKGIAISMDGKFRGFVVEPYLKDFVSAVRKLSKEMKEANWDPGEMILGH
jgi:hypothetical protein